MSPSQVSVTTSGVQLIPAAIPGVKPRDAIFIGRQDSDTRIVALSFSDKSFDATRAAIFLGPGEFIGITPDSAMGKGLVTRGLYAKVASGAAINVNVEY